MTLKATDFCATENHFTLSATVPAKTTIAPHWGGTGTTNFATNQVTTATSYTGPIVMTSETWEGSSNNVIWSAAKIGRLAN